MNLTLLCCLIRLFLTRNPFPTRNPADSVFVQEAVEGVGAGYIILRLISLELKIRKMFLRLPIEGKVGDIISHLKQTFKVLNPKDFIIREVVDENNLDSVKNRELNLDMPLKCLESGRVSLERRIYADVPRLVVGSQRRFKEEKESRMSRRKIPPKIFKTKIDKNKIVSVGLIEVRMCYVYKRE